MKQKIVLSFFLKKICTFKSRISKHTFALCFLYFQPNLLSLTPAIQILAAAALSPPRSGTTVSAPVLLSTREIPMLNVNQNVSSTPIAQQIWRAATSSAMTPVLAFADATLSVRLNVTHLYAPAYLDILEMLLWNVFYRQGRSQ